MTRRARAASRLTAPLAALALLTSCGATGGATEPVVIRDTVVETDVCADWAPILVSGADALTDGTASAILAHNLYGQEEGCW